MRGINPRASPFAKERELPQPAPGVPGLIDGWLGCGVWAQALHLGKFGEAGVGVFLDPALIPGLYKGYFGE